MSVELRNDSRREAFNDSIVPDLREPYGDSTTADKLSTRAMLVGVNEAAAAASRAMTHIAGSVATVGGEVINAGGALAKIAYAKTYKAVSAPYRLAEKWFSGSEPPLHGVIQHCPLRDKDKVFTAEYRRKLIGFEFAGAGSPRLRDAMNELSKDSPKDVDRHLEALASERRRPLDEIHAEYDRYRELREVQIADIKASNGKLEPIDQLKPEQSDFMGSNWQLLYGKVVGDRLNVDPAFGSMLNPTGGLVGPGNAGWQPDGALMPQAVAYHGAYHDAMGYLLNYQDQGPGYNYMESPFGLSSSNPLAGQTTGIAQWELDLAR
jgi:hypothetical protein